MSDYEKENKFHFLVADLYAIMQNVFHTAEAQTFDDEDYYWWAEFLVCRMLRNLDEGREILNEIEGEEEDK